MSAVEEVEVQFASKTLMPYVKDKLKLRLHIALGSREGSKEKNPNLHKVEFCPE